MSKYNRPQQKSQQQSTTTQSPVRPQPQRPTTTARKSTPSVFGTRNDQLVFGRENYKWMLIGVGVMAIGFILMSGGSMPSPDVWDESIIYSTTRTVIAPILILAGLAIEVYAIFKKTPTGNSDV